MATYLLVYKGGKMAETDTEQAQSMEAWGKWFGGLGDAVVDGGNPCGASKTVASDGTVSEGGSGVSGYSVIKAANLDAATKAAQDCPVLSIGGSIEVYETIDVMAAAGSSN